MSRDRRLWLVRHGETEGQSSVRYHGSNDVRLSDLGRAQIRALAPWLDGVPFARVVHSPLSRATESATILAEACRIAAELTPDERLREICFGACEGLTVEEIAQRFPDFWAEHQAGRTDGFPGGEPRSAFRDRITGAITEWAAADWQGDLLIVAHRGTLRHALRALLPAAGNPPEFGVELGSLSVLRHDGAWQPELLGAVP